MSEYIQIQVEPTDHPDRMLLSTNVSLALEGREEYHSHADGDQGSALAQTLFAIPGLAGVIMDGTDLILTREPGVEWHDLIEDVSDALRDFFL